MEKEKKIPNQSKTLPTVPSTTCISSLGTDFRDLPPVICANKAFICGIAGAPPVGVLDNAGGGGGGGGALKGPDAGRDGAAAIGGGGGGGGTPNGADGDSVEGAGGGGGAPNGADGASVPGIGGGAPYGIPGELDSTASSNDSTESGNDKSEASDKAGDAGISCCCTTIGEGGATGIGGATGAC